MDQDDDEWPWLNFTLLMVGCFLAGFVGYIILVAFINMLSPQ